MTQEYKGKSVYKGIALGPVVVFQKNDVQVKREKITDAEGEIAYAGCGQCIAGTAAETV